MGDCLQRMDSKARERESLDYCFDDLLCSDLTPALRGLVADALQTTLWILDEGQSKYRLYLAIEQIQDALTHKADKAYVLQLEGELRKLLSMKVEQSEFMTCTSKLASSAELQRVTNLLTDGHALTGTAGVLGGGRGDAHGGTLVDLLAQPEFADLSQRFESLTKKYVEMREYCDKLVPKEEVHEALKAVVEEVKTMRRTFVPTNLFKESLKTKADAAQVEK
jgi:hypothetical protein